MAKSGDGSSSSTVLPPPIGSDAPPDLGDGGDVSAKPSTQIPPMTPNSAPIPPVDSLPGLKDRKAIGSIQRNVSGIQKVMVDRFASDAIECVKNRAWQENRYEPESIPHRHFFDSIARRTGKQNTHLSFMAGHTHAFEYKVDKEGNMDPKNFKCGPAMVEKTISVGDGRSTTSLQPAVVWINPESKQRTIDDHTHVMTYRKSEEMSIKV